MPPTKTWKEDVDRLTNKAEYVADTIDKKVDVIGTKITEKYESSGLKQKMAGWFKKKTTEKKQEDDAMALDNN